MYVKICICSRIKKKYYPTRHTKVKVQKNVQFLGLRETIFIDLHLQFSATSIEKILTYLLTLHAQTLLMRLWPI